MTRSPTVHLLRERSVKEAFRALGPSPSDHAVLVVHCAAGHHVGALYRSPAGLLWAGPVRSRAHGDRDRHDSAHHGGHRDELWMDWVAGGQGVSTDDPLPAGCECGARSLSRVRLLTAVAQGMHRLIID